MYISNRLAALRAFHNPHQRKTRMTQNILKLLAAILPTLLIGCATPQLGEPSTNAGWSRWEKSDGGNGHYYKAVAVPNGITWMQADKLARKQGGYLASITSQAENAFVFELINSPQFFNPDNGCGPVIGGFQRDQAVEPDGGWGWVSGEPWDYSNWHAEEPNNYLVRGQPPEDRLVYYGKAAETPSATWGDIGRYNTNTGGYVIERNE